MQTLAYMGFALLCILSLLGSGLSLKCSSSTEYLWPVKSPQHCCRKCPPGEHLTMRTDNCERTCRPCPSGQYIDTFNVEYSCKMCRTCSEPNMEYESACESDRNAKCRCKAGHQCKDLLCTGCVPLPSTTTGTTTSSVSPVPYKTPSVTRKPSNPVTEMPWLAVIIALLCAVIFLIVLTKLRVLLGWFRSTHGYLLAEKPAAVEDGVSKPVQEMCGKCDQPIELRV